VRIFGLDHVTIECPDGGQEKARLFYGQALGLREVPVPCQGRWTREPIWKWPP